VRWSTVLYRMMARMKSKVSILVPWKPLYQCVRDAYMQPLNTYTGTVLTQEVHLSLATHSDCRCISSTATGGFHQQATLAKHVRGRPSLQAAEMHKHTSWVSCSQVLWCRLQQLILLCVVVHSVQQIISFTVLYLVYIRGCGTCRSIHSRESQGGDPEADTHAAAVLCPRSCSGDLVLLQAQAADATPRLPRGKALSSIKRCFSFLTTRSVATSSVMSFSRLSQQSWQLAPGAKQRLGKIGRPPSGQSCPCCSPSLEAKVCCARDGTALG